MLLSVLLSATLCLGPWLGPVVVGVSSVVSCAVRVPRSERRALVPMERPPAEAPRPLDAHVPVTAPPQSSARRGG